MVQILQRLEAGVGSEEDLDTLLDTCDNIFGRSFCALGDGATSPIVSGIKYFRNEFVDHYTLGRCPFSTPDYDALGRRRATAGSGAH
jgi:NADH-quinone oxidoreductase subunit F